MGEGTLKRPQQNGEGRGKGSELAVPLPTSRDATSALEGRFTHVSTNILCSVWPFKDKDAHVQRQLLPPWGLWSVTPLGILKEYPWSFRKESINGSAEPLGPPFTLGLGCWALLYSCQVSQVQ